jgi:DNA-binding transcriptional regulator GbsR (MarR family)
MTSPVTASVELPPDGRDDDPNRDDDLDRVERIRRRFAEAWGQMGASWGIAPSTAAVQGYLLAHGGPVTDAELQQALGLSHRAIRLALASCIEWGIVERAEEPRRSGRRGPAGRAWVALDDHWEWFRRVVEGRKEREGDPVIAILEQCLVEVRGVRDDDEAQRLEQRLESLLGFVRQFDHALSGVLRADTTALRNLFAVLDALDPADLDNLFGTLASVPPDELTRAVKQMSRMSAASLRRLLHVAGNPAVGRLLSR